MKKIGAKSSAGWEYTKALMAPSIMHYLHTVPPSSPSKLGLELQQSLHQQMVYHLKSPLTKHWYSYYTWDTQLTHPTPPIQPPTPKPCTAVPCRSSKTCWTRSTGAGAWDTPWNTPMSRRRKPYSLRRSWRCCCGRCQVGTGWSRVEVKRWIEATDHGDFFGKKEELPGLVKAYSLRTWKWPFSSWIYPLKWWFSIVMLVYQRR